MNKINRKAPNLYPKSPQGLNIRTGELLHSGNFNCLKIFLKSIKSQKQVLMHIKDL